MTGTIDVFASLLGNGLGIVSAQEKNFQILWPQADGTYSEHAPFVTQAPTSPTATLYRGAAHPFVLVGEGATLRGVADGVRELFFPVAAPAPPDEIATAPHDVLGLAMFQIANRITFGAAPTLDSASLSKHWTLGTMFPLPAWEDSGAWLVDVEGLKAEIANVNAVGVSSFGLLGQLAPRTLERADSARDQAAVKADQRFNVTYDERQALAARVAGAAFDPAAEARAVVAEFRWNPYAVMFRLLETAITLRAASAAKWTTFAQTFWAAVTPAEADALALTSAGSAWMRQLWMSWGMSVHNVAIHAGLGLNNDDLTAFAPRNPGDLEPKMAGFDPYPVASFATSKQKKGVPRPPMPVMAFGRKVPFTGQGYPLETPTLFGVGYAGVVKPGSFLIDPADGRDRTIDPSLLAGATPADKAQSREQWGRILTAMARTEGNMDASTAWDGALVSLGFQQWSMHVATEGPGLLERLKNVSPVYYDAVVRAIGLETGRESLPAPTPTGATLADLEQFSCFFVLSPTAAAAKHKAPGTTSTAAIADLRLNVFDWVALPNNTFRVGKRALQLAARWTVAATYGLDVWRTMAELAAARVTRTRNRVAVDAAAWAPILAHPSIPAAAGTTFPDAVFELFGTEALLMAAVDMAINTPESVNASMRRAVVRTLGVLGQDHLGPTPPTLDEHFSETLLLMFFCERYYYGSTKGALTARNGRIDVALERTRVLLDIVGTLRDRPGAALDATLSSLLIGYGIDVTAPVSITDRVLWA